MAAKLVDEVSRTLQLLHYSFETQKSYCQWIRRFIIFNGKRHPRDMGAAEIKAFLSHLATDRHVATSTQNQALSGLLFLYQTVSTSMLSGRHWLIASLLYGCGLRLIEYLRLRIQDIDPEYLQIIVRDGKGAKDRRNDAAAEAGSSRATTDEVRTGPLSPACECRPHDGFHRGTAPKPRAPSPHLSAAPSRRSADRRSDACTPHAPA